jgi:hypothetical protein
MHLTKYVYYIKLLEGQFNRQVSFYDRDSFMKNVAQTKQNFPFITLYFLGVRALTTSSYIVYDYTSSGHTDKENIYNRVSHSLPNNPAFFNNFTTKEDIAIKFEADLPHCERKVKEENVLLFKFRCNIFIGVRIINL